MLSFMRKHAKSWFIKVLLGTVIVVFIFFYGFNLRQRAASLIAQVNGVKIGLREFQAQYQRLLQAQQDRRSELTREQLRALKEATLDHLIDQVLLLGQAQRWNLSVAEAELKDYIRQNPVFQQDGQFSSARYKQFLRFQGQAEEDFLQDLRRYLLLQKTEELIRDSAKVTDEEVASLYHLFNERISLQYVSLAPEQFGKEITLKPDEVKVYFKEHVADYRLPETIQVEFLSFDIEAYMSEMRVSEREIEERYRATEDRWKVSKQVLARQILLRTTEEEDPKARMKVFQKAESLLERLHEGEDFEKLAKEYSQDPKTASKGGLLEWKRPGELPEALDKVLFEDMTPGELSDRPIKSSEGFHILKLEEVRSERIRPLEEVKDTLEQELKREKARHKASDLADRAYLAIFQGATFQEASESFQVPLEKTPPFSESGPVEGLKVGSVFREAAFALKDKEDFSEVVEDNGRYYIIQRLESWPSRDPELSDVEDRVRKDLKRHKAMEFARREAQEAIKQIQEGKETLSEIGKKRGWKVLTSPPTGRLFPVGGLPGELLQKAFSLRESQTLVPEPYVYGDRVIVAEIKERIPPDPKGLEDDRGLYRSILLRERRNAFYLDWLEMLRDSSEIHTYKTFQEML